MTLVGMIIGTGLILAVTGLFVALSALSLWSYE
jgi:hypothetical protein